MIGESGGSIRIGRYCIIMENAVVRSSPRHACSIGDYCLVGPNAHVTGAQLEDEVFIATSAAIFHGAHLGRGSEVRVHGTVHLRTRLEPGATVPIGWVAVGDPARIFAPDQHDEIWMRRALELAERGRGFVEPNPLVGAVVVRDGVAVGEGWHQRYGGPHAEIFALEAAGEAARGATLYVTLEPCCHHGKTPPCTDAILRAGVKRVVAAMADPFPEVAGRGAECLQCIRRILVSFDFCVGSDHIGR